MHFQYFEQYRERAASFDLKEALQVAVDEQFVGLQL
jgi:hypothetical protein